MLYVLCLRLSGISNIKLKFRCEVLELFAPAPHGACFAPAKAHRRPLRGRASIRNTEMLAVPRGVGQDPLETPKE